MVVDPHWWLGYLGQSLVEVMQTISHEHAVDLAADRLHQLVEHGPVTDEQTLDRWRVVLDEVQASGHKKGEA